MSTTSHGPSLPPAVGDVLLEAPAELFTLGDAIAAALLGPLGAVASVNLYDGLTGRVELVGAAAAARGRLDEYRSYLEGVAPEARRRLHDQILRREAPVVFDISDPAIRVPAERPAFLREEVIHHVVAPLVASGRILGTLQVGRAEPYGEEDVAAVSDAGRACGHAVANAVLVRGLRRTERIARVMSGNVGLERMFAAVLPELRAMLAVDTVRLLVVDARREVLRGAYALGADIDPAGPDDVVPVGVGFAGRIAAERVAVVVEDAGHYPTHSAWLRRSGLASLAGVPIMDDELLGVLHVGSRRPRRFKAEDLELLGLVADRLALALRQSEVEATLRRTQAVAQSVLDTAADAILTYDADGIVRTANRSVERLFGWRPEEVVGRRITELVPTWRSGALVPDPRVPHDTIAVDAVRRDGSHLPAELTVSEVAPDDGHLFTAILRDATARRASEERLRVEALHDALTELPNRALFLEHLGRSLAGHDRDERQIAVMFLDLDRFKEINDALGHAAGDELLRQAARRLRLAVRPTDVLARLGGDEFAVLLEGIMPVDATIVAKRILARLEEPFALEGQTVQVGTSIGIAHTLAQPQTPEELLRAADAALYRAKGAGRGRFDVFDEGMRAWLESRLQMESELRHALAEGEITVHYQPLVELGSGARTRLEALPRWNHPRRGMLAAEEFIAVAEETGVIAALELEVVRQVAVQLARWREALGEETPNVSVKLSAGQLSGGLEPLVEAAEGWFGRLAFEVPEGVMMRDVERVGIALRRLCERGATIVIDRFGTAYSSAVELRRLPVDVVKLDPSLVAGIATSADDRAVVHGLIELAHALGLLVVGDGVIGREQLAALEELGCDLAQGEFVAGVQPADEVLAATR